MLSTSHRSLCPGRALFVIAAVAASIFPLPLRAAQDTARRAAANLNKLPLAFEANHGQAGALAQFIAHGEGYSLYLAPGEAYVSLEQQAQGGSDMVRMRLMGADGNAPVQGLEKLGGVVNYFVGNDPKMWHAGIPTYGKVSYTGIYPGIDLVFYGNQSQLDYDFVVAPGADAGRIAWKIEGAKLSVDREGNLQFAAPNGPASFRKPTIYQIDGSSKVHVDGRYVVAGNRVTFALGAYDRAKPLIIDPILSYLTYLGGRLSSGSGGSPAGTYLGYPEYGSGWGATPTNSIAVDRDGNVYVTGYTDAYDFPVKDAYETAPGYMMEDSRLYVGFVSKLNPEGTGLVYSTYLAGTGTNGGATEPYAVAVDAEGSAYITGTTWDDSFPTTPGAFGTICGDYNDQGVQKPNCGVDASQEAFVTKLSPDGKTLEYSTLLGASDDAGFSIAVDAKGQAYVAGSSGDGCYPSNANTPLFQCFPTTENAFQPGTTSCVIAAGDSPTSPPSCYGDYGFVTVLNSAGTGLLYSTLIGFNTGLVKSGALSQYAYVGSTYANGVAINARGEFFVAGGTSSWYLPTTDGAFEKTMFIPQGPQARNAGGWVAKFEPVNSDGATIDYLTYLAPPASDKNDDSSVAGAIAADDEGNAYVVGGVSGQGYPSTKGAFQASCGQAGFDECYSGFVSKLNPSGSKLLWSTYFGDAGPGNNQVNGVGMVKLDSAGNVYFAGSAFASVGFPEMNPVEPSGGNGQAFVAEFDPTGSKLLFYSQVGSVAGYGTQDGQGLDVDAKGNIYLAGYTNSGGLETTKGAFQPAPPTASGGFYGFVAKIAPVAPTTTKLKAEAVAGTAGEALKLTATVTTPAYSPTPAGKVTFKEGSTTLGSATLSASGVAVFEAKGLKGGKYTVTASYAGNEYFDPSHSAAVSATVPAEKTTTTLTASVNPSTYQEPVTFTAKVASAAGKPTGAVTFKKNGTVLATKTLSGGEASYTTSALIVGTHQIEAVYAGSAGFAPSSSNVVAEVTKSAP